jgi:hypothetical protein
MSSKRPFFDRLRFLPLLLVLPWLMLNCGDGWDAYRDDYDVDQGPPPGQPWEGDETVFVVLGQIEVETALEGIVTSEFLDAGGVPRAGVRLSDLIDESGITDNPGLFRYDFTATDGYNLLGKRGGDITQLPNWENMQNGFLYRTNSGDLETGWEGLPWGGDTSAYRVKLMNGGLIELLTP